MAYKSMNLVVISAFVFVVPAWAHHSPVMYEPTRTTTLDGTVKEFSWTNPHSWVYIVSADASGQPVEWALETDSVGSLTRSGWQADSLRPGDKVSVTFHPMRDGSRAGELLLVTHESGETLVAD